jgi:TRAP-type mannitol/chloroaromatic compound transport system permease large subunit
MDWKVYSDDLIDKLIVVGIVILVLAFFLDFYSLLKE